jgi:hypothetical protein
MAEEYRYSHGAVTPETVGDFQGFVENASEHEWSSIVTRSSVAGITGADIRLVFRQMQGLAV